MTRTVLSFTDISRAIVYIGLVGKRKEYFTFVFSEQHAQCMTDNLVDGYNLFAQFLCKASCCAVRFQFFLRAKRFLQNIYRRVLLSQLLERKSGCLHPQELHLQRRNKLLRVFRVYEAFLFGRCHIFSSVF